MLPTQAQVKAGPSIVRLFALATVHAIFNNCGTLECHTREFHSIHSSLRMHSVLARIIPPIVYHIHKYDDSCTINAPQEGNFRSP